MLYCIVRDKGSSDSCYDDDDLPEESEEEQESSHDYRKGNGNRIMAILNFIIHYMPFSMLSLCGTVHQYYTLILYTIFKIKAS